MLNDIDVQTFDLQRFAEAIAADAREGVKWERRKLDWILDEQRKAEEQKKAA